MRVRMKTNYAGVYGVCQPGKVIDLPTKTARDLIKQGCAVPAPRINSIAISKRATESAARTKPAGDDEDDSENAKQD